MLQISKWNELHPCRWRLACDQCMLGRISVKERRQVSEARPAISMSILYVHVCTQSGRSLAVCLLYFCVHSCRLERTKYRDPLYSILFMFFSSLFSFPRFSSIVRSAFTWERKQAYRPRRQSRVLCQASLPIWEVHVDMARRGLCYCHVRYKYD